MDFPLIPGRRHRAGNALVATLIIAVTVGLALNLSSDRIQGLDTMMRMEDGRQQARLVAESIGTVLEGELRNRFDNNNNTFSRTIVDPKDRPGHALGYPGFAGQGDLSTPGLYFGKCLVRWRIEPVKILTQTIEGDGSKPPSLPYAINPNQDGENNTLDSAYKDLVAGDPNLLAQNESNFTYRIVTDSYYVGEADQDIEVSPGKFTKEKPWNLRPWNDYGRAYSRAQAVRVVQYNLVNLFEYTIFYAATGPTGDLEFWQGTGMAVKGRIHSNGAIYIGGGGQAHMNGSYHTAASANGGLAIGSSTPTESSSVTAVDGIYRMRKPSNYAAAARNRPYANRNPRLIPTAGLNGEDDYNGDTPTDGRHTINGVRFTSSNDSRSPDKLMGDFKKLVRDSDTGASVVTSLANAPQFGGLPFESQRLASNSQFLFVDRDLGAPATPAAMAAELLKDPGQTTRVSIFADNPDFAGRGTLVYYTLDPLVNAGYGFTIDPAASFNPGSPLRAAVPATNLPLWWQDAARELAPDVTQRREMGSMPHSPADGPFHSWEARGAILGVEMQPNANGRTALVIRERPLAAVLANNPGAFPAALPAVPTAANWDAHYQYLRRQYQVVFNQQDITDAFFGDLIRTTAMTNFPPRAGAADAIVTEDMFINRREANFMQMFFGENPVNFTGTTNLGAGINHQYRVNVLTLNLRRIQDFIARMRLRDLGVTAWASDGRFMKELFSGVIYAHRTRRSETYDPISRPTLLFQPNVTYDATSVTLTPQPAAAYLRPGETVSGVSGPSLAQYPHIYREGRGPIETFHAAVRVRGGLAADGGERDFRSAVNWQHDTDNDGNMNKAPLGTSKLTIITPNPMYLWGDLNLVKYSDGAKDQRTPVAVFADGLTLLSAAWQDSVVSSYNTGTTIPNAIHTSFVSSFVINNIPCNDWNAAAEGTGAVANVCRFLENWGGSANAWPNPLGITRPSTYGGQIVYTFMGSLVVMGPQRYSRSVLGAGATSLNNVNFYSPPFRNLAYNSDLRLSDGKPPQSPNGVNPIRVVSTVNLFDY